MNGFDAIAGTVRSDLASSLRLALREERWFVVDLLGGVAGYAIWVAGTAALGLQVATLAGYRVAPGGGSPTGPVLAIVGLLWIALPAIAGTAHLRSRVLNIRGNVDRVYRVDRPGALLAAPVATLLVLAAGTVLASGPTAAVLAVALVPATVYFLVRTLAYSYRVFAFSHPSIVQSATFLTLTVHACVGLAYLGLANGQRALVQGVADRLGLGAVFADVDLVVTSAPYLVTMSVFVPVALGGAYLVLQRVAVHLARREERSVSATSLRTGQRYPPWWEGEPAGVTTNRNPHRGTPGGPSAANGGTTAHAEPAVDRESSDGTPDPAADESAEEPATDSVDGAGESDIEPASHTRVYTPPKEELDGTPESDGIRTRRNGDSDEGEDSFTDDGDDAPDGDGAPDDGDGPPHAGDGAESSDLSDAATEVVPDKTCWSCGTTVPGDTDAKFCPQCGERIV